MTDAIVVLITTASPEEGERIATALVSDQLAACVNLLGPIRSIYRWDGQVQNEQEWLLVAKTRAALFEQLDRRVRSLHSYQTPEVIALPIVTGSRIYLDWLYGETTLVSE
jgi:periplasmic divalent cation tolerance protein